MNLKRILAFALALASLVTITVTAFADSAADAPEANSTAAASAEKRLVPFKNLLDDGVVSEATYEKMLAYLKDNIPQKTERQEQKNRHVNILDKLLEANVVTQAEYDAIKAAAPTQEKPAVQRPASGERPSLTDKPQRVNFFDKYVEDGIISEKTADAIQEYLKSSMPVRSAVKETVKERTDIYSKMLEAGVLTQAEYDAIKKALPERTAIARRNSKAASDSK